MFEDFLKLSYDKCPNKIRTIRELINRFNMNEIIDRINRLSNKIDQIKLLPIPTVVKEEEEKNTDLPDLIVESINTKLSGINLDIIITVQNISEASMEKGTSAYCDLNVVIEDYCNVILYVLPLKPGEKQVFHFPYNLHDITQEIIYKTIVAEVDSSHKITEINETNNINSTTFETYKRRFHLKGEIAPYILTGKNKETPQYGGDIVPWWPSLEWLAGIYELTVIWTTYDGEFPGSGHWKELKEVYRVTVLNGSYNMVLFHEPSWPRVPGNYVNYMTQSSIRVIEIFPPEEP